ncbi:hypothetical protein [Synechococcus sp. PCC 6312]|uniref:hypothetical protein n=1 Tax=Synechococcus sp. (strain ATCC 27167 / PCC 6312) TaxID=195253 RepID=UPI00029ED85C|nr:hypothetical protein [Synechococcus sp. PCC 6312]AFY60842.1 hypothetical protein Syn6312_1685 [Synechococcus sp. PCC 6312]
MLRFIARITLGQIVNAVIAIGAVAGTSFLMSHTIVIPNISIAQSAGDDDPDEGQPIEDDNSPPGETEPQGTRSDDPKRFKIQLSITDPTDLKVRQGDTVQKNQVLADRAKAREMLTYRKQQLAVQINRMQARQVNRPQLSTIRQLPAPDYLAEQADVQKAQLDLNHAQEALSLHQRKMGVLQTMAQEVPPAVMEHEQRQLEMAKEEVNRRIAAVSMANAKLVRAQQQRQYTEYQHQLELAKLQAQSQQSQIDADRAVQEQTFQLAQLQTQADQIESQLQTLSTVRSPYAGKVARIRWLEQSDTNLRVELTLDLQGTAQ